MRRSFMSAVLAIVSLVLASPSAARAQILVAGEGPVVYGHHHLNTTNMAAQKKFFVDTLGGKVRRIGVGGEREQEIIEFPNVLIFFRPMQAPTGGTIGTTVNHIGFSVPNLGPLVAKIKANGFKMITTESVAATVKVTDDIAAGEPHNEHRLRARAGRHEGGVRGGEDADGADSASPHPLLRPAEHRDAGVVREDVRREDARPPTPAPRSCRTSCRACSSTSRRRRRRPSARRAVRSITSASKSRTSKRSRRSSKPTASSSIVPYTKVAALGIAIAFIKDPWGTNIELTEGLDAIK